MKSIKSTNFFVWNFILLMKIFKWNRTIENQLKINFNDCIRQKINHPFNFEQRGYQSLYIITIKKLRLKFISFEWIYLKLLEHM